jgi:hypothetical protein
MVGELQPRSLLIDDVGRRWPRLAPRLAHQSARPAAGAGAGDAIRHLGFVAVRLRADSIHIQFRPDLIARPALVELYYLLAQHRPASVALSYYVDDWRHEIRPGDIAVARIDELVACVRDEERVRFCARRRQLASLDGRAFEALRALIAQWRHGRRVGSIADMAERLDRMFAGCFALARQRSGSARLVIAEIGRGFPAFDPRWLDAVLGRAVDEAPDPAFGAWVGETYREVLAEKAPRLEDVEALVRMTDASIYHVRGRRMIAPFVGPENEPLLASVSVADSRVNLLVRTAEAST